MKRMSWSRHRRNEYRVRFRNRIRPPRKRQSEELNERYDFIIAHRGTVSLTEHSRREWRR
jgi:hypothetical protein